MQEQWSVQEQIYFTSPTQKLPALRFAIGHHRLHDSNLCSLDARYVSACKSFCYVKKTPAMDSLELVTMIVLCRSRVWFCTIAG